MKLNWGCGPVVAEGWVSSDQDYYVGLDHQGDILAGLPWPDGTFGFICTNHALSSLAYVDLVPALAELRRVLRRGEWLRILVPDLWQAVAAWVHQDADRFLISDDLEASLDGKLCVYLTQASAHRSIFTAPWLCELCVRAGFRLACRVGWGETNSDAAGACDLDSREKESLIVEACK